MCVYALNLYDPNKKNKHFSLCYVDATIKFISTMENVVCAALAKKKKLCEKCS